MSASIFIHSFAIFYRYKKEPRDKSQGSSGIGRSRPVSRVLYRVAPGSNHSSRPAIAHWLKQPTRVQYGPYLMNPYLALLRVEFTVPRTVTSRAVRSYRTLSPLPDPTCVGHRRFALCCTSRGLLHPPGVTWHLALWSPDFPPLRPSPPKRTTTKRRLSGQLRRAV